MPKPNKVYIETKKLEQWEKKLRTAVADLRDTRAMSEIEHDAKKVEKVADDISTQVKGSGTGSG